VEWKLVGRWWVGPAGIRVRAFMGAGGGQQPKINGPTTTQVEQTGDPELRKLNKYVTGELLNVAPQYGGIGGLLKPQDYQFTDYGAQGGPESQALGRFASFYKSPTENPYELAGLGTMQGAADPEMQLAASKDYLSRIAAPEAINYNTAAGMGRSGAVGESIANAGAKLALPILQQSAENRMQLGGTMLNYGQLQRGRQLEGLQGLYSLAAMPRMEQAAADSNARNTLLSSLLRFPVASGAGMSTQNQFLPSVHGGEPPVWQQVMGGMGSALQLAAMVGMMCHVAKQLYGWDDPRKFIACFYQVNVHPKGWLARQACKLYRRYGKAWSESRLALCILRPIFDRVALAGARNLGVVI